MLPIVTPEEMAAIDAAAPEGTEVLIERAGAAVAWAALRMLGGAYGRTVNVICGKGNNGADGRVAAGHLAAKGVRVRVIEVPCPAALPPSDLVIDAAFGTGFHGTWSPPDVGDTPVLAVDLPSGVDALTGDIAGAVLAATRTVTFGALKPGLLMPPGSVLSGELELADIGLDVGWARANLVLGADVAGWWPERDEYSHKWRSAVRVIAGSSTMTGAPRLVSHAAMRTGAGMVHLSIPGMTLGDGPIEIVQRPLPSTGWAGAALGIVGSVPFDRGRSRPRQVRRHRGKRSPARARSTAADGDRRRRVVCVGLELGGCYDIVASPHVADGADTARR